MKDLGKFKFVEKHPVLFSLIVTFGLELSKFFTSGWASYMEIWISSPILKLVVILVQFLILFSLAKVAVFVKNRSR